MSNRILNSEDSFLLVIDIQEKFMPVVHNADELIHNTGIMIQAAYELNIPIVVSEQFPRGLGSTAEHLKNLLRPETRIFEKTAFSCMGDLRLTNYIKSLKRHQVIVTGLEAHVCVNQTVHHLLESGYEPHIIRDAITSRNPNNKSTTIRKMVRSGAVLSCTEMALFEMMRGSTHPAFRSVQKLIK